MEVSKIEQKEAVYFKMYRKQGSNAIAVYLFLFDFVAVDFQVSREKASFAHRW